MKLKFKKVVAFLLISLLSFSLLACGSSSSSKPEDSVKNFLDAVKKQDIKKASEYTQDKSSDKNLKYDNAEQEKLVNSIFSRINYNVESTTKKGSDATVKTKISTVDMQKIAANAISSLMPTIMSQALSGDNIDEAKITSMVVNYMAQNAKDPKSAETSSTVDIKLVKQNGKWLIKSSDDLVNIMTGNLAKASEILENQSNNLK